MSPRSLAASVAVLVAVALLAWPRQTAPIAELESSDALPPARSFSSHGEIGPVSNAGESRTDNTAPNQRIRLRVIDSDTDRGVPGTTVWFVAADRTSKLPGRYRDRLVFARKAWDRGARFRDLGVVVETDERGFADVPLSEGPKLHAFAEHGTSSGVTEVDLHGASDPTLVLAPGARIRFVVEDAAGAAIAGAMLEWSFSKRMETSQRIRWMSARTDADGFELRHANLPPQEIRDGVWQVTARARVAGTPYATQAAEPVRLGEQVVRIRLGAVCVMRLRIVDTTGALLHKDGDVLVRASDQTDVAKQTWSPLFSGEAEIPVAAGRSYIVRLSTYAPRECEWTIDVPLSVGPRVTRTVTLPAGISVLSFRAVDRDGKPIADQRLDLGMKRGEKYFSVAIDVDADGRAQALIPPSWSNASLDHATLKPWRDRGERASLLESSPFRAGRHELGDVVIARNRAIATGTVELGDGTATTANLFVQRRSPSGEWTTEDSYAEWNGNRFELYSASTSGRVRVRAMPTRRGNLRPSAWHEAGDRPLSLVLAQGRTVTVALSGVTDKRVDVYLHAVPLAGVAKQADQLEQDRWRSGWRPGLGADAKLLALPTGRYRIELHAPGTPGLVHAFEADVKAEGPAPSFAIDLSRYLRRVRLRLTRNGKPVTGFVTAVGAKGPHTQRTILDGVATLWLTRPATVVVHEPGKPVVELPSVFADATIDLER